MTCCSRIIAFIAAAFAAATAGAAVRALTADASGGRGPRVVCDRPVWDFGVARNREFVEHAFILRNAGDRDLHILDIQDSCRCTSVVAGARTIRPGQTTVLRVKAALGDSFGLVRKSVRVRTDDPTRPVLNLEIRGRIARDVEVDPPAVIFGTGAGGRPGAEKRVRLYSGTGASFHVTGLDNDAKAFFSARVQEDVPGKAYTIVLRLKPDAPAAPGVYLRQNLHVLTDNPNYPRVRVLVTLYRPQPVVVSPDRIVLRAKAAGDQEAGAVGLLVWSPRHYAIRVESVGLPDPAACAEMKQVGRSAVRITITGLRTRADLNGTAVTIRVSGERIGRKVLTVPVEVVQPASDSKR